MIFKKIFLALVIIARCSQVMAASEQEPAPSPELKRKLYKFMEFDLHLKPEQCEVLKILRNITNGEAEEFVDTVTTFIPKETCVGNKRYAIAKMASMSAHSRKEFIDQITRLVPPPETDAVVYTDENRASFDRKKGAAIAAMCWVSEPDRPSIIEQISSFIPRLAFPDARWLAIKKICLMDEDDRGSFIRKMDAFAPNKDNDSSILMRQKGIAIARVSVMTKEERASFMDEVISFVPEKATAEFKIIAMQRMSSMTDVQRAGFIGQVTDFLPATMHDINKGISIANMSSMTDVQRAGFIEQMIRFKNGRDSGHAIAIMSSMKQEDRDLLIEQLNLIIHEEEKTDHMFCIYARVMFPMNQEDRAAYVQRGVEKLRDLYGQE